MSNNYLLIYRLRWYRGEMLHKLMRYKHGLFILLALLAPDVHAVFSVVLSPIRAIMMGDISWRVCFFFLASLQILFVAWAAIQRSAIMGMPFRNYFYTLPVTSFWLLKLDILLLIVANLLLWVPFIFVFFEISSEIEFVRFFIVVFGVFISQLLFLYRSYVKFFVILVSNLFFVVSAVMPEVWLSALFAAMSFSMLVICALPINYFQFFSPNTFPSLDVKKITLRLNLPLEMTVLVRKYIYPVSLRLGFMLVIAAVSCILLKCSALQFHYWSSVQCFMTLITCIGSALYALLHETGHAFRAYLKTLPCSEFYWSVREFFSGAIISFCVSVFFLFFQYVFVNISLSQSVEALIMQIPLHFFLYLVRTRFIRQATFLSIFMSAIWGFFLVMCIDRGYL